jgi:hypothetical protein
MHDESSVVGSTVESDVAADSAGSPEPMKILLIVVIVAVIAGSIYADYRWRKWVNARRLERRE